MLIPFIVKVVKFNSLSPVNTESLIYIYIYIYIYINVTQTTYNTF